jgi:hypothetical protein
VAAAVSDGLLAFGVRPAGPVGDQLAVVAGEEVADDLGECAELGVREVDETSADVVTDAKIAAGRLGVPGPGLRPALLVGCRRVADLVVVDAGKPCERSGSPCGHREGQNVHVPGRPLEGEGQSGDPPAVGGPFELGRRARRRSCRGSG